MSADGWAGKGTLTKTGWPRPIVGGKPIPWVSPADQLSTMNNARAAACASGAVCAVCGEGHLDSELLAYAFILKHTITTQMKDGHVFPMDNGVLHARCAKLALKHCPKLRQLQEAGNLAIIATGGNLADPVRKKGKLEARIDGEYCVVVEEIK
jgi:hypothetical protein